jgi:signal transduction histidine kinase
MQTQLTGALRQRERLAQLGEAVAKISHDLRNILTSATTLMADRIEASEDPTVQARWTPKMVNSITRAVNADGIHPRLRTRGGAFAGADAVQPAELPRTCWTNERLAIGEHEVTVSDVFLRA